MRCKYGFCLLVLVCIVAVLCGPVAVSAASVETTAVPDETVDLFAEGSSPEENAVDPDSYTDFGAADIPALYAVPDAGTEFSDLAYLDVSSSLGDIRLYLPYGVELPSVQLQDGLLYNTTSSTIYLYCPEYPDYTFSASRFQNVTYRTSSNNYSTYDLTDVSIIDSTSTVSVYLPYVELFALVFIIFALLWRRSK